MSLLDDVKKLFTGSQEQRSSNVNGAALIKQQAAQLDTLSTFSVNVGIMSTFSSVIQGSSYDPQSTADSKWLTGDIVAGTNDPRESKDAKVRGELPTVKRFCNGAYGELMQLCGNSEEKALEMFNYLKTNNPTLLAFLKDPEKEASANSLNKTDEVTQHRNELQREVRTLVTAASVSGLTQGIKEGFKVRESQILVSAQAEFSERKDLEPRQQAKLEAMQTRLGQIQGRATTTINQSHDVSRGAAVGPGQGGVSQATGVKDITSH